MRSRDCKGRTSASDRQAWMIADASATTKDQRPAREARRDARTSGNISPVGVVVQARGRGNVRGSSSSARSASSITCCVPIFRALRRPDLIQRRTVSGSRWIRSAASGTVNIVARCYNNALVS